MASIFPDEPPDVVGRRNMITRQVGTFAGCIDGAARRAACSKSLFVKYFSSSRHDDVAAASLLLHTSEGRPALIDCICSA